MLPFRDPFQATRAIGISIMRILHIMTESAFTSFTRQAFNDANSGNNIFRIFPNNSIPLENTHNLNIELAIVDEMYINSQQWM